MPCTKSLPYLLKELRLPALSNQWEERAQVAEEKHWSYGDFLSDLMELEHTYRLQKRLERAYKNSRLPVAKTLSNFNFDELTSLNIMRITRMAKERDWVDDAQNLVLFGPSGVGKTHIASAIGYGLLELGVKVFFSSTTLLVQMLQQAKLGFKLKDALDKLGKYDLLILDDMGYVKKSEQETSVLFELIAHRYESGSMIITANQAFGDWDALFPDKIMAVAAVDRIVHHATIINLDGSSWRAKYAKEKNQFTETGG